MTSFKKLDHRQSTMTLQERSKMLAAKPKFGIGQNREGKENPTRSSVGVSSFKVYTESDTAKADAGIRSYATVNKVSAVETAAALKAGLKSLEKRKGILGSSAGTANVGRRALADVSNLKSNSSRIVGDDASKKMEKGGKAYVPVSESFGFADELRRWTAGAASALLVLSHWEALPVDPFFLPKKEEELEEFDDGSSVLPNTVRKLINAVRWKKGLPGEEKIVQHATKQRTQTRKV